MRVLHAMASGARGGGADHLLGLLPALRHAGVECSAAVGDDGPLADRLRDLGFATWPLQLMASRGNPLQIQQVASLVRRAAADVVHFHGTRAAFFGAAAHRLWGALPRSVYTAHGLAYRKERRLMRRLVFLGAEWVSCRADAVLSVSSTDLDELAQRGWLGQRLTAHVPNAVDVQRFAPSSRTAARQRLGLDPAAFIVGTTSRLVPQKSVADLLDGAMPVPHCHVVVLGDGPLRQQLQQHPLVHQGRAHLLGARDDVPACLPAFDVFALTSHWEGEPIALLEAMACGLPCVATRTAGAVEILQGGKLGLLVDIGRPEQLTAALQHLATTPTERARWGAAGSAQVAQRTYAQQAARLLPIYQKLTGQFAPGTPLRRVG